MLNNKKCFTFIICLMFFIINNLLINSIKSFSIKPALLTNQESNDHLNIDINELTWFQHSPILEKISTPIRQKIKNLYQENNMNNFNKAFHTSTSRQMLIGNLPNVVVNDINQEDNLKVQNQPVSAAFNDNIVIVYNKTGLFPTSAGYSFDGGTTWQESSVTSVFGGSNLGNSAIASDNNGIFYVVTIAMTRNNLITVCVSRSEDGGASWGIASDAVGANVRTRFVHDRPWIAVDSRNRTQTNVYVSWTQFDDTDKRSSIMFSRSTNGGSRFLPPIEITPHAKDFNVDGSRLALGPNGEIYISWVDNKTGTIFLAKSTNNGVSFSSPMPVITLSNLKTPEFLNGSFRTNIYPSLAVDTSETQSKGFVYLTYNARIRINSPDKSDVFLLHSTNGGQNWDNPVKVNDDQTITDQWMPSVTVNKRGNVVLLWYDRRNNPVNNSLVDVYTAVSFNQGQSFLSNIRITDTSWPLVPTPTQLDFGYHGEYNQISTQGDFINLNWADDRNGTDPNIYFAKLSINDLETQDFSLSGRTIFATTRPNQTVTFLGETLRVGAFNDFIQLSATSNLPNAAFQFSSEEVLAGNSFDLTVLVPNNTQPGNYTITVTGTSKDRSRATVLRITVLNNNPETKPPVNLSKNTGTSTKPKMITDAQGSLHLVWQDDTDGVEAIFYANSLDGNDFSKPVNLSRNFDPALKPTLISDLQGRVHIVWQETNPSGNFLVYTRTDDLGKTFLPRRIITSDIPDSVNPSLAIDQNGVINLVWSAKLANSQTAILLAQSKDAGENFTIVKSIATTTKSVFYEPTLTIDSKNIMHLAYAMLELSRQRFDTSSFIAGLFYQRSVTEKLDFAEPLNLIPKDFILADSPILLANGLGQVVLIFAGFNNQIPFPSREIYYTQSFDNGASFFFSPNTISNGNGDSTSVSAAYGVDGVLNVLWRDTQKQNFDIFVNRLVAGEREFLGSNVISQNLAISDFPAIATNKQGNMVIVWADESVGNSEIVFFTLTSNDLPVVQIDSFSPTQANINETVSIKGQNFNNTAEVKVGQLSAKFKVISNQDLEITVPNGAVAGGIEVFSTTGQARSKESLIIKGKLGVQPSSLDFGQVLQGKSITRNIQLVNPTNSSKLVHRISFTNPGFSLNNIKFPLTIPANSSMDIPIIFVPAFLSLQGSLAVISTDNTNSVDLSVELIGTGLDNLSPQVTTVFPLGGEEFIPEQQVKIAWRAQDNSSISKQEIQLSTDGGNSFSRIIVSSLYGVREFFWTVPDISTITGRIKIVSFDLSGNKGESVTLRNFTIKKKKR